MSDAYKTYDNSLLYSSINKMDKDIAINFVLSGLSLDKKKVLEAFITACEIMSVRAKEKQELLGDTPKSENSNLEKIDQLIADMLSKYHEKK